jgi:hypothetical protein
LGIDSTPIRCSTWSLKAAQTSASAGLLDHIDQVATPCGREEQPASRPASPASFNAVRRLIR